jgi:hypothetical protein
LKWKNYLRVSRGKGVKIDEFVKPEFFGLAPGTFDDTIKNYLLGDVERIISLYHAMALSPVLSVSVIMTMAPAFFGSSPKRRL